MRQISKRRSSLAVLLAVSPFCGWAHGELDIQIGRVSGEIAAAHRAGADLYFERADLYRQHLDWNAAFADLSRAAEGAGEPSRVAAERARVLEDSGQFEAARDLLDSLIRGCPQNVEHLLQRARVLQKAGEVLGALTDYEHAAALAGLKVPATQQVGKASTSSLTAEVFREWAESCVWAGRTNDALFALDLGVRQCGPLPLLQVYAMELEMADSNFERALARVDTLVAHEERKEHWYERRGELLQKLGRLEEARSAYLSSLAAVKALPLRLQLNPPLMNLQAQVNQALKEIDAAHSSSELARRNN